MRMAVVNFDENKVLLGCVKNDLDSQRLLYEHHKIAMFTLCLRYATDRSDAEDILQDGFIQVFRSIQQFDVSRGVFEGWMRKVFINTALQQIRKKKMSFVEVNDTQLQLSTNEDVISQLSLKELMLHIQQLPPGYRTVFNMYVIDGMQHNEIAESLQISVNTSKSQLFKAKQILKKTITAAQNVATHYDKINIIR
jgi:RNA polymerase sigma-70 factor (ECF subfamily)